MSRASAATRERVWERDQGCCVICGERGTNVHRRVTPGHGGRRGASTKAWEENLANLLLLCGSGTTGDHGMVTDPSAFGTTRAEIERRGYVVSRNSGVDPAEVPVLTALGWERFTSDGKREPV